MASSDEFDVTVGKYREGENELWQRIIEGWRDMRASTRRLLAERPSEARLLFYVLVSDMIFFLSWSIKTLIYPSPTVSERMPMEIGYWLIVAMLFRTSCMYFFSIVIGSGARLMGGKGDWPGTRTACFWGALVAAPAGFVLTLVTVAFAVMEPHVPAFGQPWLVLTPYAISLIPFVWFVSEAVAEVHGFKRSSGVFFVVSILSGFAGLFGMLLKARGLM